MKTILAQVIGVLVFTLGTVILGRRIRRVSGKTEAQRASRISHLLFWGCLLAPGLIGLVYPGLRHYDELLGFPSLPLKPLAFVLGLLVLLPGIGLMIASNHALSKVGRGSAAFFLTKEVVLRGVYLRTRNPMSLGFYMACVGVGFLAGSLAATLGALLVITPVHLFNLKYFEERELELRFGEPYRDYRRHTPFLLPRFVRGKEVQG